ncbi:MAG: hypothetical protein Q8R38_01620 [Candidatus Omnitrophota bacterium]|nr:hypothetical protein [Candidatus Omnitrophota bacterium]
MRKLTLISVALVVVVCFAITAQAATTDKTVSVTASASITGATSLTKDASAFTYGTTNADAFPTVPASKRVVLTYSSNYNPWKIDIYTNNTQIPTKASNPTNGSYAKGGLVAGSVAPYNTVPLKWVAKDPVSAAPVASAINFQTSYNFVKDIRDEDDPATNVDNPLTPAIDEISNESWDTPIVVGGNTYNGAFTNGYPNVAFGPVVGGGGVCVDPTNTASGPNQYRGDPINGTIAVYVAGLFTTGGVTPAAPASAGSYSGTIYFDLYHP